jgi:ankyrin repeat protein
LASEQGCTPTVVQLLKHGKVSVNLKDKHGYTALFLASINGHTEIIWELLKHDPCEALVCAIEKADMDVVM